MSATGRINADRPSFLCGLIGAGIQASLTPAMHEREGDEQGFQLIPHSLQNPKILGSDNLESIGYSVSK